VLEADPPQRAQQYVSKRGEPQAQLIGPHGGARRAVGIKIELTFLDTVFHLAAGAVELLVEIFGFAFAAFERGDDIARICLVAGELRLGNDAPLAAPAPARLPAELLEIARRLAGARALGMSDVLCKKVL
jgi:hypothetical protein